MNGRGIDMEALSASSSKYDRDVVVVWMLRCQEVEELSTSSITFATVLNNEMNVGKKPLLVCYKLLQWW